MATEESFGREVMQREENGATTESKKTLWVMLEDPQHVLRKDVDWVSQPDNTFERVGTFRNRTIGALQYEWKNALLFRCRLEDHPDYRAPKAEPLRWSSRKPDTAGIWAWRYSESDSESPEDLEFISEQDLGAVSTKGIEWCYIGTVPVILPPPKKVLQRLWLKRLRTTTKSVNQAE